MYDNLRKYLEEISHYLDPGREKEEILAEIKSHIMEKAEGEFGEVTEKALARVIDVYGSPRKVAEKYMEETEIIAPSFKGYLIRYTLILFSFHFTLSLLSLIFKTSMLVFPFFYIPPIDSFEALFYIPMAFVFDLGLVGIILYFVTQSRKEVRLPWPKLKLNWQKMSERRQEKSKVIPFLLMVLGYGALVWVYLYSGTLFFKTIDFQKTQSLLTPGASQWYSLALLGLLGIGLMAYVIKFFIPSEWVNLSRNFLQLGILGIVINRPVESPFIDFVHLDLQLIASTAVAVIAVWIAVDFLKSLVILGRKALMKKTF